MKKILTLQTGIVFLITILAAGACSNAPGTDSLKGKKKVEISCKIVEIDGKKHLEMYDSNNPQIVVIDTLLTDVKPGTKITWVWAEDSEVQEFLKISPKNKNGKVMKKDAEKISGTKKFEYKVPRNAPTPSEKEKYDIVFLDKEGNPWKIDPYLKVPKQL